MSVYAEITDSTVTNIVVCDDPDYADAQGWVPIAGVEPAPTIGWTYEGSTWTSADFVTDPSPQMITVDPSTLNDLATQVSEATTVTQVKAALLATLAALGADLP